MIRRNYVNLIGWASSCSKEEFEMMFDSLLDAPIFHVSIPLVLEAIDRR